MIRIAICDDQPQDRQNSIQLIRQYTELHPEYDIVVSVYQDPYELLADFDKGMMHDIYILDIIMPKMSGIQLGQRLRSHNSSCVIIFCTVSPEYALESYCVQAQNYLLKPFEQQALFHTLDMSIQRLNEDQANGISFRTAEGLAFLPYHRISYIELDNRRMVFHLTDRSTQISLVLRGSFEDALADLLKEPRFVQPHKSYVVNMASIRLYSDARLTMDDGASVPISVRKQSNVSQRYFAYLSNIRCELN